MMNLVNYHTHSERCGHAIGNLEDYVEHAMQVDGLREIGLSAHFTLAPFKLLPGVAMQANQLDDYVTEASHIKDKYQDKITVRIGLEVDYFIGEETSIKVALDRHQLDYVIGSVHYVEDFGIDDSRQMSRWNEFDSDQIRDQYYHCLCQGAKSGLFDIVGHLDLIKKFNMTGRPPDKVIDQVLTTIRRHDLCIEINSSGWDKPCQEQYPARYILELAYLHDIPITLGTDAHAPIEIERYLTDAAQLAKQVGYRKVAVYSKRRRGFIWI